MEKRVHIPDTEFVVPTYIAILGNLNSMPQPWKEIDHHFFYRHFHQYPIQFEELRCVKELKEKSLKWVTIYWYHHMALAILHPHWTSERVEGEVKWKCSWLGQDTPRYYLIGCEHDFETRKLEMCLTEYKCTKCGLIQNIDSSD